MNLYKLTASGLGTGYFPVAPGTAGAALGILLFYGFNQELYALHVDPVWIPVSQLIVILLISWLGVYSIKKVHQTWEHDAQTIVIDEIVGVWIAAYALPLRWQYYLYAFILFRLFDIYKPLFIRKIDKLKNDWSVMLDDMLAGVYALVVLQLLLHFKVL
ncbi:phosphatidylglycerophosphatase A [Candidatus Sulfidibacterium hydrothermale]|uniref:phosphatidylglycerophosphatase A family protein n=1 Tax=Candidatus Sulfidibacterium hydrothermale TaxID=2875962 RepID=UPI001F0B2402|nr:phosphatidylglycerophosphatase A [Candidatus Sulfidibacterium hydrothermale]UBM63431.1 phosphatidylglycerophosphatase A [Candidatus Sulfidibacterium hydrothermale]